MSYKLYIIIFQIYCRIILSISDSKISMFYRSHTIIPNMIIWEKLTSAIEYKKYHREKANHMIHHGITRM